MTQKQAIKLALEQLGGRARLGEIYQRACGLADFSGSNDPKATIRSYLLRETKMFRSSQKGWWELVSYQEELARRDQRIKELECEVERLKAVRTEDDFVARFVEKVKHNLKRDKKTVEEIRKLMDSLGRDDADKALDEWLQGIEKRGKKSVTSKFVQKNINSQVFTGNVENSGFYGGETGH